MGSLCAGMREGEDIETNIFERRIDEVVEKSEPWEQQSTGKEEWDGSDEGAVSLRRKHCEGLSEIGRRSLCRELQHGLQEPGFLLEVFKKYAESSTHLTKGELKGVLKSLLVSLWS